jgi:hypothetical protein
MESDSLALARARKAGAHGGGNKRSRRFQRIDFCRYALCECATLSEQAKNLSISGRDDMHQKVFLHIAETRETYRKQGDCSQCARVPASPDMSNPWKGLEAPGAFQDSSFWGALSRNGV